MTDRRRSTVDPTVTADPVTAAQQRADPTPVLAGIDPEAMDETVGAHDGTVTAGQPGFSTSDGAGRDVETDVSEGRVSSGVDVAASDDAPTAERLRGDRECAEAPVGPDPAR